MFEMFGKRQSKQLAVNSADTMDLRESKKPPTTIEGVGQAPGQSI